MAKQRTKRDMERSAVASPSPEPAALSARATQRRPLLLVVCAAVIGAALLLRLWSDKHPVPADSGMTLAEAEQRARAAPNDETAQLDWGARLYKAGRFTEAATAFDRACQLAPNDAQAYGWRALTAFALKRPDAARADFLEALKRDPNDAESWQGLARVYESTHESSEAMGAYRRLTQLRPKDAAAWRQLGVHYVRLGSWLQGQDALQRAVALDPSDAAALHHLGLVCFRQGRLTEAKEALDRTLALRPENPSALMLLADVTLRLDPSPEGLARAEQQIDRALAQGENGARHQVRGRVYLAQHRYAQALAEFKTALRLDPALVTAHVYLSQAYALTGQPELARKASQDYMKLRHDRPEGPAREEAQP